MMIGNAASKNPAAKNAGFTKPAARMKTTVNTKLNSSAETPRSAEEDEENQLFVFSSYLGAPRHLGARISAFHFILAERVARNPLSARSSESPLLKRLKSICIPRHIFF